MKKEEKPQKAPTPKLTTKDLLVAAGVGAVVGAIVGVVALVAGDIEEEK